MVTESDPRPPMDDDENEEEEEEVTRQRAEAIAAILLNIRLQLQFIKTEELERIIHDARRDEAIGPLLDSTRWIQKDLFTAVPRTINVLEKIIKLKKTLEGE